MKIRKNFYMQKFNREYMDYRVYTAGSVSLETLLIVENFLLDIIRAAAEERDRRGADAQGDNIGHVNNFAGVVNWEDKIIVILREEDL